MKPPVICFVLFIGGCNALTPAEKQQYENLIEQGARPVTKKDPAIAAILNIGPGLGDLYNGEMVAFAWDWYLWFFSIPWAVPQGAITASNINKKATIAYYTTGEGKDLGFDSGRVVPAASKEE